MLTHSSPPKTNLTLTLQLGGLLLVSLLLRLLYLRVEGLSYDEGHWLMFGTLAAAGHPPYTETFVGIPPLALLTIQLGAELFGYSAAVRLPMLLYSLVGVAAIFWLVNAQAPKKPVIAALLAAGFLSFGPNYFIPSVSIMAEVPALALALLSVALVQVYQTRRHWLFLVLSGAALALSLTLKVFVIFTPLIVGLQLLVIVFGDETRQTTPPAPQRGVKKAEIPPSGGLGGPHKISQRPIFLTLLKLSLIWSAGFLAVIGLFMLIYNPAAMYHQVIEFRLLLRDTFDTAEHGLANSLRILQTEMMRYLPLTLGAILGLILAGRQGLARLWIWPVWLGLAALFIFSHVPLRPRHTVILLPPLAALSGVALTCLGDVLSRRLQPHAPKFTIGILAVSIIFMLINPLQALASPPPDDFIETNSVYQSAIDFVRRTSQPTDCLVVDDQRFAFEAGRLVPPFLSETSEARLRVGWLEAGQIAQVAADHDCPALVVQTFRFRKTELHKAVREVYALRLDFKEAEKPDRVAVYAVDRNTTHPPPHPIDQSLNGQITLKGLDLSPPVWQAGGEATISLYWFTAQQPAKDYKIFFHIRDAQGHVVAAFDRYPFQLDAGYPLSSTSLHPDYVTEQVADVFEVYPTTGYLPTRLWLPGNTLKETFTIALPDDLPAGLYRLYIGMYDETTLERLPVRNDTSGENAIFLKEITVQNP